MAEAEVREGFLCPICMNDLGSVDQLQTHFEQLHNTEEDSAVFQQLKGLFGKAKQKILKKELDVEFDGEALTTASSSGKAFVYNNQYLWEPQEIGATTNHTDTFKQLRDSRVDRFVVETNKLVLRLDKLIGTDVPKDSTKRKMFEKSIVPWVPDSDIQYCLICGASFNLAKRRHHCRLCGGIMCSNCSVYLPFPYARKLTNPTFLLEYHKQQSLSLPRRGSSDSLNSMMNAEGEPHLRICLECKKLLDRRDDQIEQRMYKPIIQQFYERMKAAMEEVEKTLPEFARMADSLDAGEITYELADAQKVRLRLVKLFETVDLISKKIEQLNVNDETPPQPRQLRLQKSVRLHASAFLQENMRGLANLPSEEQLTIKREKRKREIQSRIAAEKQAALEALLETQRRKIVTEQTEVHEASPTEIPGWMPTTVIPNDKLDPMVQQINIIRDYIKKARQAKKFDEVKMLEANLKELQLEYKQQLREKSPS